MPVHTPAERAKNRRNQGNDIISGGESNDILLGAGDDTLGGGTPDAFSRFLARTTGLDVSPAIRDLDAVGQAEPGEERFEYGPTAMGRQPRPQSNTPNGGNPYGVSTYRPNMPTLDLDASLGSIGSIDYTGDGLEAVSGDERADMTAAQANPAGLATTSGAPVTPPWRSDIGGGLPEMATILPSGSQPKVRQAVPRQAVPFDNSVVPDTTGGIHQRAIDSGEDSNATKAGALAREHADMTPQQLSERYDDIFSPFGTPFTGALRTTADKLRGGVSSALEPVGKGAKSVADVFMTQDKRAQVEANIKKALDDFKNGDDNYLETLLNIPELLPEILRGAAAEGQELTTAVKEWLQANMNPDIIGSRISDTYDEYQRGRRQFRGRTEGRDEFSP